MLCKAWVEGSKNKLKRCSRLLACQSPLCTYFILIVEATLDKWCYTQFINKIFRIIIMEPRVFIFLFYLSLPFYMFFFSLPVSSCLLVFGFCLLGPWCYHALYKVFVCTFQNSTLRACFHEYFCIKHKWSILKPLWFHICSCFSSVCWFLILCVKGHCLSKQVLQLT